uniref:Nuclear receptor domain-containing protein n=1 Tax=Plectus sambesii TaxID=2011161 RepID=A0A914XLN7_9BILA
MAHSTRSEATLNAVHTCLAVPHVLAAANWSLGSATFARFCQKLVERSFLSVGLAELPKRVCLGRLCSVCSDIATGRHYSAYTCDGCDTFFRRTVKKNLQFHCSQGGTCVVSCRVRWVCRACRYEKCLMIGMNGERMRRNKDQAEYSSSASSERGSTSKMLSSPILSNISDIDKLLSLENRLRQLRQYDLPIRWSLIDLLTQPSLFDAPEIELSIHIIQNCTLTQQTLTQAHHACDVGSDMSAHLQDDSEKTREEDVSRMTSITAKIIDRLVLPMRQHRIDMIEVALLRVLLFLNPGQQAPRQPTFLSKYLTPPQLTLVSSQFKKGHQQPAVNRLQRFIRRLPKPKQDEFNKDFRAWVEANAVHSDTPVTADLSFLTVEQRDSINRKLLKCDKLAAMRELREHIDKLPKGRRDKVLRAFRSTLPNLDFLTPEQWEAIQAKTEAGDENGAKALIAEYIRALP